MIGKKTVESSETKKWRNMKDGLHGAHQGADSKADGQVALRSRQTQDLLRQVLPLSTYVQVDQLWKAKRKREYGAEEHR